MVIARRGEPVAVVLGVRRLEELRELEGELRDLALVMSRVATDDGRRRGLDDVIDAFGFSRADLERDLDQNADD